ncbi:GNAT family N-acetyltransferase [Chitinophaga japonensis]|uniref:ElaA protein n=1 Tax=Chitinophaga japonensis TaxID=104662 RepID=A0A562TCC6_CHIJA|nr:GNAT family N-acetyltransferase [Chitinophaga japonensis]TWI91169.1 ElaA protein [Chitinophaga japonensis]
MTWIEKTFDELSTAELYALLHLRNEIFIVEQRCPYQDLDYADQAAVHVMGYNAGMGLVAYTRIFGPGARAHGMQREMASIGRVLTAGAVRGKGIGRVLMERSIAVLEARFGRQSIQISAQQHLKAFYESLGFRQTSEMYLEDDIPHICMIRSGM